MSNEPNSDRDKLYAMIDAVKIAMFTTIESDGSLHTRPMGNREADEDGALWFFADKTESVAKNLAGNSQVGLGYADPKGNDYVAISGTASVVEDRGTIESKWVDSLQAWFPEGKADPKIVLIKVDPHRGEYWDSKGSVLTTVVGFIKAKLGGGPANDLVDQGKVAL